MRTLHILPILRNFLGETKKNWGVVFLPPEKTKTETSLSIEFWGGPFKMYLGRSLPAEVYEWKRLRRFLNTFI